MKLCVLQLPAEIYKTHLYRNCNYDEKRISSPLEVGGQHIHGFKVGGGRQLPPPPALTVPRPCLEVVLIHHYDYLSASVTSFSPGLSASAMFLLTLSGEGQFTLRNTPASEKGIHKRLSFTKAKEAQITNTNITV